MNKWDEKRMNVSRITIPIGDDICDPKWGLNGEGLIPINDPISEDNWG